jgi:hypothetical protein
MQGVGVFVENRLAAATVNPNSSNAQGPVGRASRLHRECRRFEPVIAHHPFLATSTASDFGEVAFACLGRT